MALGTTGLVVTAALAAGAVGAGAAVAVLGTARPAAPAAAGGSERVAALEERLAKQETEIASLRSRLEEAAWARASAQSPGGTAGGPRVGGVVNSPGGELEVFDPAVLQAPSGGEATAAGAAEALTPAERTRFEAVYRQMREKEQEEGRRARQAAYEAQLRGRLDRLPAELALSAEQKDAIVKILLERGERLRQVMEEARASGDPEAFRAAQEKTAAIRQESRQTLQQTLTQEQVKAVENLVDRGGNLPGRAGAGVRQDGGGGRGRRNAPGGGAGGGEPTPPR